jgi:hypothetical protein
MKSYTTPQDLVDAISEQAYFALFDDGNTLNRGVVDASTPVTKCIRRAHAQVTSFLPRIYKAFPSETAGGIDSDTDSIPALLKDAELQFAIIFAYRRHQEYVRTFGAEPGGKLMDEALELMERIATAVQQIPPTDSPPEPSPRVLPVPMTDDSPRLILDNPDGSSNLGDF